MFTTLCLSLLTFTVISQFHQTGFAYGLSSYGINVCSISVGRSQQYNVQIGYRSYVSYRTCCPGAHVMWCWKKCTRYRGVTRYRYEIRHRTIYSTRYQCCNGWRQQWNGCPIAICNNPGCVYGRCVRPNTCDCSGTGYTNPASGCSQDINECQQNNGGCYQNCRNRPGSYLCYCRRGFTLYERTKCRDNDECSIRNSGNRLCSCADPANNPLCTATCLNTIGSYRCNCSEGYRVISSGRLCADINECLSGNNGCNQHCENLPGSYRCSCLFGYALDSDGKTCIDVDECLTSNGGCQGSCTNSVGSYHCSCNGGLVLDGNGKTCSDVDECKVRVHGCQQKCNNLRGSYYCSCNDGYQLNSDNRTCTDKNECTVSYNPLLGINTTESQCSQSCHNTYGSYYCSCNNGYVLDGNNKTCSDVNECELGTDTCQHECVNTIGSYQCRCQMGYVMGSDRRSCLGMPCSRLPPIINGNATCFTGTTNQSCQLNCFPGFTLRGSNIRRCLPTHKWSGARSICYRLRCPSLTPPPFGSLQIPCERWYQASCHVKCLDGYYLTGSNQRMCRVHRNNTIYWSGIDSICKDITSCTPNPCRNKGKCSIVDRYRFTCNCTSTGYGGEKCDIGIIQTPAYPTLLANVTYDNLAIVARPTKGITVKLTSTSDLQFIPEFLRITYPQTIATFSLRAPSAGLHVIKYNINGTNAVSFSRPKSDVVFAVGNNYGNGMDMNMISDQGQLIPGCHKSSISLTDSRSLLGNNINIISSAPWTTQGNQHTVSTDGVTEMATEGHYLPISLVGSHVTTQILKANDYITFIENYPTGNNKSTPTSVPTTATVKTCANKSPSTGYLNQFVNLNIFPQSIIAFFNYKSPYWIRLSTDLKASRFSVEDFTANVYSGYELSTIYPKCSSFLQTDVNSSYYVYSTRQNITLYSSSMERSIAFGNNKCIIQSMNENALHIVFPELNKLNINSVLPLGFDGELSSIGFGGKDNKTVFANGEFTTEMISRKGNLIVTTLGNMKWMLNDSNEVINEGVKSLNQTHGEGYITIRINLTAFQLNADISGKGKIETSKPGTFFKEEGCKTYDTKIELIATSQMNLGRFLSGTIRVKEGSAVKIQNDQEEFGGELKGFRNMSRIAFVVADLKQLNTTYSPFLQMLSIRFSQLNSKISAIIQGLTKLAALGEKLMKQVAPLNPRVTLHLIIDIRNQVNSLLRRCQVLANSIELSDNMSIEGQSSLSLEFNTLQKKTDAIRKILHFETIRYPVIKKVTSLSIELQCDLCVGDLCFTDVRANIFYIVDLRKCKESFSFLKESIKQGDDFMLVVSITNRDKEIEEFLQVQKGTHVYYLIGKNGEYKAWFNASVQLYGQEHTVIVRIENNTLNFQLKIRLLDTDVDIVATSSLDGLRKKDPLLFVIDGKLSLTVGFFQHLESYLKDFVLKKIATVMSRNENAQVAFNLSQRHLSMAMKSMMIARNQYEEAKHVYDNVLNLIKIQKSKYRHSKSILQARLISQNNTVNNYTKAIEDCSPKLCIPKCIPGLAVGVCQEERYVHRKQLFCSLIKDSFVKIVTRQTKEKRSYVNYHPVPSCKTKCPPLTGFFKKIFGRKRRGLITKIISEIITKVAKAAGQPLFGYLGGKEGALGAKIGGMLPGPLGIVGMFVGGIIGSMFGSCDKLCTNTYIPETISYDHYGTERVAETVSILEQKCLGKFVQIKAGFEHAYECLRPDNCTDQITDVECVIQNQECHVIREHLREMISSQIDLGQTFNDYVGSSLAIEALERNKVVLFKTYANSNQTLKLTKAFLLRAKAATTLANQTLENIKTVLAPESAMSRYVKVYGNNLFNVTSGNFKFYHVSGNEIPTSLALDMSVKIGLEQPYPITTLLNLDNFNESIADAAMNVVKTFFHSNVDKRVRRASETSKEITNQTENLQFTSLRSKCLIVEQSMLYIVEILLSFTRGVHEAVVSQRELIVLGERKTNFTAILNETTDAQALCNNRFFTYINVSNNSSYNCSLGVLSTIYSNLTNDILTTPKVMSWEDKRSQIIATLELLTKSENFSDCSGLRDCADMSFEKVNELIQPDNSKVGMKTKVGLHQWRHALKKLLNNKEMTRNQTKSLTEKTTYSIKEAQPNLVFCGENPLIIHNLPPSLKLNEYSKLNLSVKMDQSIHTMIFIWKKDGSILKNHTADRFIIDVVSVADEGVYACEILNRFGKSSSIASKVKIQRLPKMLDHPNNVVTYVQSPTPMSTMCNVSGIPYPNVTWMYAPFYNISATRPVINKHNISLILPISHFMSNQSGFYYCNASNDAGFVVSKHAKVKVLESNIATFPMRILFNFKLWTSPNASSNASNITAAPTSEYNATHQTAWLPLLLSDQEKADLKSDFAKYLNTSVDRIIEVSYSKQSDINGLLGFTLNSENITYKLHSDEHESSNDIAEDITMTRKEVLLQAIWLHYTFKNISNQLKMGNVSIMVDADTMQSDPLTERCPYGFRIHTNGFVCEKCPSGSYFDGIAACKSCPFGTFQSFQGQKNCIPCQSGYTTSSVGAVHRGECVEVNECAAALHNCHQDAICKNTIGSFRCLCKAGFSGDGRSSCEEVNECVAALHNCHQDAVCKNTIGSFRCLCKEGFSGDGRSGCEGLQTTEKSEVLETSTVPSTTESHKDFGKSENAKSGDIDVILYPSIIVGLLVVVAIGLVVFYCRKYKQDKSESKTQGISNNCYGTWHSPKKPVRQGIYQFENKCYVMSDASTVNGAACDAEATCGESNV